MTTLLDGVVLPPRSSTTSTLALSGNVSVTLFVSSSGTIELSTQGSLDAENFADAVLLDELVASSRTSIIPVAGLSSLKVIVANNGDVPASVLVESAVV